MINDPWFYAAAIPAVLIVGISKSGFAGGIGLVGVPLMALVISPVQAAGIMLPILVFMDALNVWAYRNKWDRRNLTLLFPGGVLGIAIGMALAEYVSDAHVRLVVGTVAVVFALSYWLRPASRENIDRPNGTKASFWGTVAGFTSFVAHAGSPPVQVYLLPQRLEKTTYVATTVAFFTVVNWIKIPAYGVLGMLAPGNLWTSLALAPLVPIGIGLGLWLHKIIPEKPFYLVCYVAIFAVGVKLIWDGVSAFL